MDNELGYCKDLYDLIEEYVIGVSPDDVNAYYVSKVFHDHFLVTIAKTSSINLLM